MSSPSFIVPRRFRAAALTCATSAAVLAVLAGAAVSHAAGSATAASVPRCATSGLVAWIDTNGDGTLGHIFYNLEFTNLSGHACTLRGYPGVSAVNLTGHRLGRPADRDTTTPVHPIHLANGQTVSALLRITDVGVLPAPSCGPTTAAGLRVYPPNQAASKIVPFPFGACSRTATSFLSVRAVH